MSILKKISGLFLICILCSGGAFAQDKLTIERIFDDPSIMGPSPRGLKFSPDGKRVSFLQPSPDDFEVLDLWEYNIEAGASRLLVSAQSITGGEEKLSQAERARRERMRITSKGIVQYSWSEDGSKLLFPLGGDLYLYTLATGQAKRLTHTPEYETDARFSPKGHYVSFIQDDNIYVIDVRNAKSRKLTKSPRPTVKNGSAEFIAMEEMNRDTGYWWSPDEKYIAYVQFDEASVAMGKRYEIMGRSFNVLEERYPHAGEKNVTVKLGVMAVSSRRTKWIDLGEEEDIYLARVNWLPDSSGLVFQRQNRAQTRLDLIYADAKNGRSRMLISETSDSWINLHHDLVFLKERPEFIWASERSGYKHLYRYNMDGTLIGQMTAGKWDVGRILKVDEAGGQVFFDGFAKTPLERHLFKIRLMARMENRPDQITVKPGTHSLTFPKGKGTGYIDKYSDPDTPSQVSLHNADGSLITWIEQNELKEGHPYFPYAKDHISPEFGNFEGPGGQDLYYRMYKPANMEAGKKYPVIVALYGGPTAQLVRRSFGSLWHQYMAQRGYVVFTLDNRGSANRGMDFATALHKQLGKVELEDQVAGVEFLKTLDFVDGNRIGVQGHSYGGYMALMAMFKASDVFQVGVAGAPPTDWSLYDTHYTERYLGTPQNNPDGYEKSSVFPYVEGLKGKLLLIHGMADDNVIFDNSTALMEVLQKKNIQFDFMGYPGQTHRIGSDKMRKRHFYHLITRYFDQNLKK